MNPIFNSSVAMFLMTVLPVVTGSAIAQAAEKNPPVELMFVQTSEKMVSDDKTLRLVNVGKQTLYFSDRPNRVAGNLTMPAYMDE